MVELSFGAAMTALALAEPDRPAITCAGDTLTRARLEARANQRARALQDLGVGAEDRVVLALPNGVAVFENAMALWKLGATPVLTSHRLPLPELHAIIEVSNPRLVIGGPSTYSWLAEDWEPSPDTSPDPIPDAVAASWKAPCSGGSTGTPKVILEGLPGVIDSDVSPGFGMRPGGVQLVTAPLYHNAPFGYATRGLLTGQHVVVMPRFDAAEMLELIERHRVEWVMVVPTMMNRVHRLDPAIRNTADLSSLRNVWHMAAACPPWLKQFWIDWLGADVIWELYGSTEQIAATAISGAEWLEHPGSVGRPIFGEITILTETGGTAKPGEVGEIYLRSPEGTVPFRYLGAEAQRTPEGWTSVGDLGSLDEEGYLFIADRRIDLILSGGANVYPAEVEAVLEAHPDVAEAVVIGLPDEDLGQRVHAIVRRSGELDSVALLEFTASRIARYKTPRSVEFVDVALRDDAGKVRRSRLRSVREGAP